MKGLVEWQTRSTTIIHQVIYISLFAYNCKPWKIFYFSRYFPFFSYFIALQIRGVGNSKFLAICTDILVYIYMNNFIPLLVGLQNLNLKIIFFSIFSARSQYNHIKVFLLHLIHITYERI